MKLFQRVVEKNSEEAFYGVTSLDLFSTKDRNEFYEYSKEDRIAIRSGRDDAPLFLFRYFSPPIILGGEKNFKTDEENIAIFTERLECLLLDGKLYLNSKTEFNDPFDSSPVYVKEPVLTPLRELAEHILKKQKSTMNFAKTNKTINDFIKNSEFIFDDLKSTLIETENQLGICCFTISDDNLLMWAHYARDHKGFCIKFDTTEDYHLATGTYPVKYNDCNLRPIINLTKKDFSSDAFELMLEKSKHWSYENEWRLVEPNMARKYINIKPEAIDSVTLGARVDSRIEPIILSINVKREIKGLKPLIIKKACLDEKTYTIKTVSV